MYALNIRKGTTIQHPEIDLPGWVAVPVNEHLANQLKNITNVVLFDKIVGISKEPQKKELYNLSKDTLEVTK